MITSDKVQKLINLYKRVEDAANREHAFSMEEIKVQGRDHPCNTTHCVAGWAVVANGLPNQRFVSYVHGIKIVSDTLGFCKRYDLQWWAEENPEIWGNEWGDLMFVDEAAYNGLEHSTKPMTTIINHWRGVKYRLKIQEIIEDDSTW